MSGRRALRAMVVASLALFAAAPAQAAKPRPDLTVSKASAKAASGRYDVTWTIKNGGKGAAGKSTTALVLSADAKLDAKDAKLGTAAQKAIKAKKAATGKRTATVPPTLAAGRYSLLVCADSANKVKENSEGNNCRVATTVDVKATLPTTPAATPIPQPSQPTPPPGPIDNPPEPLTVGIDAPAVFGSTTVTFKFVSAGTFECRIDARPYQACDATQTFTGVLAGEHTVDVIAHRGGETATAHKTFRVEFEAPAPGPTPPAAADPQTRATGVTDAQVTTVSDATKFLYTGNDPIQKGVAADAVKPLQAAVMRGRVVRRNGTPVEGVEVTVLDHPELGRTATRTDGGFDIAVNGGGSVTLSFARAGYIPSQRRLDVPTQDYDIVDPVVIVPYEDKVTGVDLATNEIQVATGSEITDSDGTRKATLLLDPGTNATATLPDGTTKDLGDTLNIRATEFTIGDSGPAAMPGELPPTSAYTYAVEYSVDEADAQKAVDVEFDKPVVTYVDNLLDFPAGTAVPMGYYDREKAQWVAAKNGIVIKIVGESGGRAQLDVTGDGRPDSVTTLGIDDAELQKLAQLYDPGKSLWRAAIDHFTPWDYNWPYGLPDGAGGPGQGGPNGGDPPGDDPCNSHGSIILCENQVLGERSPISGTPYTLAYQSDRVPGRRTGDTLVVPLTGATLPPSLKRVDLQIDVAGRTFKFPFTPKVNDSYTFVFDGKDAYGRRVQGRQKADITLDYVYPAVYRTPDTFQSSFAQVGGAILSTNSTRTEISVAQRWSGVVGDGLQAPASALAGWSIDVHHTYDPVGHTLYLGDGSKRSADGQNFDVIRTFKAGFASPEGMTRTADGALLIADGAAQVIRKVEPDGTSTIVAGTLNSAGFGGDGGPATDAELDHPADVAVGPDGALYIADQGNNRIRRVLKGTISTIAGTGDGGYAGDGGPAHQALLDEPTDVAADGSGAVLIIDRANQAVRRIGPDGVITTLAGTGVPGFSGDGDVATKAKLRNPRDLVVTGDGSVLIADSGNQRVRRIGPDGVIATIAGNGETTFGGDGGLATAAHLDTPSAVAPTPDGGLVIADSGHWRVRKVQSDGTMVTIAGNGEQGTRGDGGPAGQSRLQFPSAIVLGADGTIYFSDETAGRVRSVAPSLPALQLGETTIASDDGRSVYVFDPNGRHLRTVDSLTKATVLTFGYDAAGRLTSITDGDGHKTTITRDGAGTPTSILAPYGQVTTLGVTNGYLSSIKNFAGDEIKATYDAGGLLKTLTDPRGELHSFDYDPAGRLIRDTAPGNASQTLTRTSNGDIVTVVRRSAEGRTTTYRVEPRKSGEIERSVTDGKGAKTTTLVGTDGVVTVTRPDGTVVTEEAGPDPRFGMDAPLTARMTVTSPAGLRTVMSRARTVDLATPGAPLSLRSFTETTTVNGRVQTSRFDADTLRWTDTSPAGRQKVTTVDGQGRPLRVESAQITPSVFTYVDGRLTKSAQGARTESYAYDARGRVQKVTDALGRDTTFTYDDADRPLTQTTPDNRVIAYSYDRNGNLLTTTPPGKTAHKFDYSTRGVMTKYTPPQVGATTAPTSYTADDDALVTAIDRPSGDDIAFAYDDASRLEKITHGARSTTYAYNNATGRLTSATAGVEKIAYLYDGALPTKTTVTGSVAGVIDDTYDDEFRVKTEAVSGGPAVAYAFDPDGQLTGAGALTIARNPANGLITGLTAGVSTTTITPNAFGETGAFDADVYAETYARDDSGRITGKTEKRTAAITTYEYGYDTADRLATIKRNGATVQSFTYDANGNRDKTSDGQPLTYDGQDRINSAGYEYTPAGELHKTPDGTTYDYDALGALRKVTFANGKTIDYAIDSGGRRVAESGDGSTLKRRFLYGRGLGPVAELDSNDNVVSRFIYATHSNVPDLMIKGGKTYRIVTDQVGSPRSVIDVATGTAMQEIDYDAFGNITRDTDPGFQPFRFAGGLYDVDTKLVRFGARDYDPRTGRFLAPDPLRFGGGGTNLYGYALADPVNLTDPSGQILDTILDIGFIAYDLYRIGKSLMNGCGVDPWDVAALGADVAGALIPFATGGGAAVRAGREATEGVYEVVTKEGLPYVGQSNNIDRRLAEHVRDGKITQEAADAAARTEVLGGKTAREVAEQRRINDLTNGVGASDPGIANKVNPIGPKRQHLMDLY
ncbi:NHL domain-containing protein [Solirubrobacter soli]|uniref:NHL domain-containing protein n=1 Tax=Solirubrobacter soli TaxID=363832 RepID=UPI000420177F|nr:RHS repeat-associated core domain-containing protein [Solirubrobacter soli]